MSKIENIINTYNKIKNNLRFDGEYLNYFASILSTVNKNIINYDKIKYIRRFFSDRTAWHSSFRGTGLYTISIILSFEEDLDEKMEKIIEIEQELVSKNFRESSYLALASYILHKSKDNNVIEKFMDMYDVIHGKSDKITCEEDYPMIALIVYKNISGEILTSKYDDYFSVYKFVEVKSNDITQDMVIASIIFSNGINLNDNMMKEKIEAQYAILYPIFFNKAENTVKMLDIWEGKLEEHVELQLFMNGSFRRFLAMVLILQNNKEISNEDLEMLISLCILNFTKTQETSILSDLV